MKHGLTEPRAHDLFPVATTHHISEVVRAVCNVRTEPDGIEFDPTSIEVVRIKEGAEYEGFFRVTFVATLERERIPRLFCEIATGGAA
jgi:hypothetical protein